MRLFFTPLLDLCLCTVHRMGCTEGRGRVNYEVYGLYGPEVQCMAGSSVMLAADLFCANDG